MTQPAPTFLSRIKRFAGYLLAGVVYSVSVYSVAVLVLSSWVINRDGLPPDSPHNITLWLQTNGVHTDLIVPMQTPARDWRQILPWRDDDQAAWQQAQYVAIGWGDRGFYLDTPTWSQLKPSTALIAATGLGKTLMHVTRVDGPLVVNEQTRRLEVSPEQYQQLLQYVDQQFERDRQGHVIPVTGSYGTQDRFYAAKGSYSLLMTCNTWVGQALKTMQVPAPLWTPFDTPLLDAYPMQ